MAFAPTTSNFGGDAKTDQHATRLDYSLSFTGRLQSAEVLPRQRGQDYSLDAPELEALLPELNALDVTIASEILGGQVYGQLGDAQLARILSLLARRKTFIGGKRLRMSGLTLSPRVTLQADGATQLRLCLCFVDEDGDTYDPLQEGRLLAGPQAFFLKESRAMPIDTRAPWELARWARNPVMNLDRELTPQKRDQLVNSLREIGIPDADLGMLAVRRGAPERIEAHLGLREAPTTENRQRAAAICRLFAVYDYEKVEIQGQQPGTPYLPHSGDQASGGILERDLVVEDSARGILRSLGFRYDRDAGAFGVKGEMALQCVDPKSETFPADWTIVQMDDNPEFRGGLEISSRLELLPDRGLLSLTVEVNSRSADNVVESAAPLVGIKDLIAWFESGQRYLRLGDGSYVLPSEQFKNHLALLEDLGVDSSRALISPLCAGILRRLGDDDALQAADDATAAWLAEVSGGGTPMQSDLPDGLNADLREYQRRGFDWLQMLDRHRLAGILADDMGLGKTLQTLALILSHAHGDEHKPSLVVAPTSVLSVWRDQATQFCPTLRVVLWHGPPKVRHATDLTQVDLAVTSYGIIRRDIEQLSDVAFRYVILDEAQSAKNAASQNAAAVRTLKSERRLALTGTPVENRTEELWSAFDFLAPGFLGTLNQFRRRYARPIERGDQRAIDILHTKVRPLILRRMKGEVAKELPDKIESVVRCDMGAEQRALYEHIASQMKRDIASKVSEVGVARAHLDILAALMKLRQICCDPALLCRDAPDELHVPDSAKLELFSELLREALESDRKILVFSQFVEMQKLLIKVVQKHGVDPLWLHGGTRNREEVVAQFQDPSGPPVMVISLRAGGVGLNLTRADTVIHYDPWWNPAVERQATDRAHRLGQKNQVLVYKLVCTGTIEDRVLQLAERKDALVSQLLGSEGGEESKRITTDDVLRLLS